MLEALRQTLHTSGQPYHISSGTPQQPMFMPPLLITPSQMLPHSDMVARLPAVLSLCDTCPKISVSPIVHALSAAPPLRHRSC